MKIGFVTEYYHPTLGGIQEHVHHLAIASRRAGHDVRIITPRVTDRLASQRRLLPLHSAHDGVIHIGESIPFLSRDSLARASVGPKLSYKLREVLRSEQFDVLHLHSPLMPTLPLLALRLSDAAIVGTFHSEVTRSPLLARLRPLLQRYLDKIDAPIGVSEVALGGLRGAFRAPWRIIPNGVDVQFFRSGIRRAEFNDGRLTVLHVGRFDPRNGVHHVIRSWTRVRRWGIDARLVLVGDGPLRGYYEGLVPPQLRRDVHFAGFVSGTDLPSYYRSADVLLCPARGGTFGIILLEAMAAGCPIVAADTPGFRTVMQDRAQGILVDLDRPDADGRLAKACATILTDPAIRSRYADACRATALQYDWSLVSQRVLGVYRALLTAEEPKKAVA